MQDNPDLVAVLWLAETVGDGYQIGLVDASGPLTPLGEHYLAVQRDVCAAQSE